MWINMRIKEFAEFTGVSVRTLHHYDKMGLLKPAYIDDENGYRYYDKYSLIKMQEIMFYRELDFPLKEIRRLMDSPDYDRIEALKDQKALLQIKKERLDRLILAIDDAMKGENIMKSFNNIEFEAYKEEAKKKWGNTEAYAEYEKKTSRSSKADQNAMLRGLDDIMKEFASHKESGDTYDSDAVQEAVSNLKKYITDNFYSCTNEILAGLGKMYVADERFKNNIDKHGEGTAEFISNAIECFVK